jgi:sugar-specific transcriptional regulator TrmB
MKTDVLTALGLDEKAAKIYLAALAVGTSSVQTLARKANLKRPTAYLHIEELVRQGLMQKVPIGKKDLYRALDPSALKQRAQQSLEAVNDALPSLLAMQTVTGRPKVTVLEGRKGIRHVYEEVREANNIRFWSALSDIGKLFSDEVEMIAKAIHKNQIRTREITNNQPQHRRAIKSFASIAGKTYSARVDAKDGIGNDNVIYGDVTALIRIHEFDLYVVKIEDPFITKGMRALFDMAWETAKPLR